MSETSENIKPVQSDEIDLIEIFHKIWNGRKTIFKWMGIFFVIGIIIVLASPKEYKSEITLLVETGSSSNGMSGLIQQFGGLAGLNLGVAPGEDALTPELYPDIIKSTPLLLEVMNKKIINSKTGETKSVSEFLEKDTYLGIIGVIKTYTIGLPSKIIKWISSPSENIDLDINGSINKPLKLSNKEVRVTKFLSEIINAKVGDSENILIVSVETQDPLVSAQLTDSVVFCLTQFIVDYRTHKAKEDLKFVTERYFEAKMKYIRAQQALAIHRDQNKDVIRSAAKIEEDRLQAEFTLAFNIFNTLSQQFEQSKMKVQEKTPVFKIIDPAKVPIQKSKPKTIFILLIMILLGSFAGIITIYGDNLKMQFKKK